MPYDADACCLVFCATILILKLVLDVLCKARFALLVVHLGDQKIYIVLFSFRKIVQILPNFSITSRGQFMVTKTPSFRRELSGGKKWR